MKRFRASRRHDATLTPAAAPYSRQRNRLRMGFSGDFDVIPHPPATAGAAVEKGRIPDRLIDPAGGAARLRLFSFSFLTIVIAEGARPRGDLRI